MVNIIYRLVMINIERSHRPFIFVFFLHISVLERRAVLEDIDAYSEI